MVIVGIRLSKLCLTTFWDSTFSLATVPPLEVIKYHALSYESALTTFPFEMVKTRCSMLTEYTQYQIPVLFVTIWSAQPVASGKGPWRIVAIKWRVWADINLLPKRDKPAIRIVAK